MDFLLASDTTAPQTPLFQDQNDAHRAGLPTPPPMTETQTPALDEDLPHHELVLKHKELQAINGSLWSQIVTLQAQNDHWVQVYNYIEKGLDVKVKEMNALVQENQQLKVLPLDISI